MTSKNKIPAEQVPWTYNEAGDAVPSLPKSWETQTVVDPEQMEDDENFIRWDRAGASIAGVYLSKSEEVDYTYYQFQTGTDPETEYMRCHGTTQLDRMMAAIPFGGWLSITYQGEVSTKTAGRTFKLFEVTVAGVPLAA